MNYFSSPMSVLLEGIEGTRPSSPIRQDGERRSTSLDEYAFRRVPFFSFWLIFGDGMLASGLNFNTYSFSVTSIFHPCQAIH